MMICARAAVFASMRVPRRSSSSIRRDLTTRAIILQYAQTWILASVALSALPHVPMLSLQLKDED